MSNKVTIVDIDSISRKHKNGGWEGKILARWRGEQRDTAFGVHTLYKLCNALATIEALQRYKSVFFW